MVRRVKLQRTRRAAAAIALLLAALAPLSASASRCDRSCLSAMITQYVDALVAQDPARLPVTADLRYTEDSRELQLGEGLWKTVTANGGFRQDYLDTRRQLAAAHVQLLEGKDPVLYSLLLHVKDSRISGIETLVERITPLSRFQPTQLGQPLAVMNDAVPASGRQSRASMIRTALTYTEGLRIGSFVEARTVFAREARRIENGVVTSGAGCGREDCTMQTQKIMKHPDVSPSVALVDEDNGVVLLWMNFGDTKSYGPGNALVTFEAFKVWGRQIHAVNAFFHPLPATTPRGWPSSDPLP